MVLRRSTSVRGMGFYGERVLPRLIDKVCGSDSMHDRRRRVCAGLHGRVVELGFGSGHNVAFYPDTIESVAAVEPADAAWSLAQPRLSAARVPVERVGLDGARLPLDDASCDSALSTWTMCTIPDLDAALAELRRVLVPGGTLHFVEHGLAPEGDDDVRRWQRRLEPLQKRIGGGCHLTRPIADLVRRAGFEIVEADAFYEPKNPRFVAATTLGTAVNP